ncbi:restriction endonuclease subunit S [Lactobacillus delbrueckii subsp. lactis]|uniref:restriction endonuclease subunit S n=2 Tax=Lactobacillus delbrueckii TaxID=1584 RepID=UPI001E2E82F4|nr:restriction endonuclease subunit S [Lactobacillus delbrueckii]MCD9218375.1 restriction endonuclease subunit S [Lactobacillus delbrueckii subsp. lactis]
MKVRLGDVLELNPRESIVKNTIARKISMTDLKPFTRDIPTFSYEKYSGGAKFRNNDILLARITPCLENGKTALVNILDKDEVAFGSTEYFVLRAKKGLIDPYYLYYLSISQDFRNVVIKSMTGTSGRQRAQKDAILEYKLDLPNIQEQQSIAKQLRALDDKIRLNKQINDNLSEINKTVFSNFFANQNSITKASDIADIRIGKTPPRKQKKWFSLNGGYKWLSIKDMKRDGIFALHTEEFLTKEAIEKYNIQVVPKHTVMLSFKLTIGRVKISEENMVTNEAIAQFRNSKLPYEYLYTYLGNFSFETLGSTSSIAQAINSRIIKSMPILIPERDLLNKYLNFARPIFSKMLILQKENIKLNRLKQVLLDKYF